MYGLTSILLGALPLLALGSGSGHRGFRCAPHPFDGRGDRARRAVDTGGHPGRAAGVRRCDRAGRAAAVARPGRGLPPGAQPGGLAAVGHRTADGLRPQLPVPDLRQPAHPVVAAATGRQSRCRHRDFDRAADPEVHRDPGRRVPGRRHHGGLLRTRRRLDPRRQGHRRPAGLPGQLGYHPARAPGARRRSGRGAVGDPAQGQGGLVVAGQSAGPPAPPAHPDRRAAHLPPVAAAEDHAGHGRDAADHPGDRHVRDRRRGARHAAGAGRRIRLAGGRRCSADWCCSTPAALPAPSRWGPSG